MALRSRILARSLAALVLAAAVSPAPAHAWPFGKLFHMHPGAAQPEDARISFYLANRDEFVQQVKVDGHVYTISPHTALAIKAPEGTEVYAATSGLKHRVGDVLIAVTPHLRDTTISIQ
jgi:murein DD-endopeptidase MepM/ murein hydrolase activator NlpD